MSSAAIKPTITFGKFANVDMRVVRVISAPRAQDTHKPCRVLTLDAGPLGTFTSVGQYALLGEEELVGAKLIAVMNLAARPMGSYTSEVLVLGVPHPESPDGEAQALPLYADPRAELGSAVF